ncbi:hypothetical protein [Vitiosangium sp. GDMCC 1.1324]|uniref:monooxygenase n=1 Tax=Vitiosangium sp. (strain GDMCC 1.1324) TaxID=2138576 RepID=UPI000D33D447|nr:hypothetical protein [Vitiosangium sp. GDMCC 1.1324]PTL77414.1 hypothetical protein DAT35_44210 [Vitiosangium sp. GDMCC 1.1324]
MRLLLPPPGARTWLPGVLCALAVSACTEKPREPSPPLPDVCAEPSSSQREVTYYRDVKPVLDVKCAGCHQNGGIAPFALTTPQQVQGMKDAILHSVCERAMPPWPPHRDCNQYDHDRSLSDEQIALLRDWVRAGAPLGNESDAPQETPTESRLTRVDLELVMPEPYTPQLAPDEYRCFLLDWPETEEKFITGLGVVPGQTELVHHVLIASVPPEEVDTYARADEADPGPGFSCPGGPTLPSTPKGTPVATLVGGWVPGGEGADLAAGTGVRIRPGSKLVMQMHYNTSSAAPVPDVSKLLLKLDGSVEHEAFMLPFTDPRWVRDRSMSIPKGETDVVHIFSYDALEAASRASREKLRDDAAFTIYGAGLHMHRRGTRAVLTVEKSGKESACLLEVPEWDFHWQGVYSLQRPVRVSPGEDLRLECHWNNAGFLPHHGAPVPAVADLNWGEGTDDEMCIAFLYVTQEG